MSDIDTLSSRRLPCVGAKPNKVFRLNENGGPGKQENCEDIRQEPACLQKADLLLEAMDILRCVYHESKKRAVVAVRAKMLGHSSWMSLV